LQGIAKSTEVEAAASELSRDLLAPIAGRLYPSDLLVLVPDGNLEAVPFAMLKVAETKGYLIESHRLAIAPSASVYISSLRHLRELSREPADRALVVGDPAFDPHLFSGVPRLPGAVAEAAQVAAVYPHPELLVDRAATPERLTAAAGAYPVIHLSVHTFLDSEAPLLSRLALAPSRNASGVFYGYEIQSMALARTRLVVLAGCETAGGPAAGMEGVMSLARFFMAAGAPAVVASLWRVDDALTARFMVTFHRAYRNDGDPSAALREVQLQALRSRDPALRSPSVWAAFVAMGAAEP
jgi:CHAT domain-containing protein